MGKSISPMQARNDKHLLALRRDNYTVGDYSILITGDEVDLTHQKLSESPRQSICIPREEFNRLVRWYVKPQKPTK